MNRIRSIFLIALLIASGAAMGAEFAAKVIAVLDGDTLLVTRGGEPMKIRLAEIDAPEKDQPYGAASQRSLAEMVMGRQVQITSRAVDDYGRTVAVVGIGDVNVNREQIRRGMAWEYSRLAASSKLRPVEDRARFHGNRELVALQREAQREKRGLWAGKGNIEPFAWRKQHPRVQSQAATPGCGGKKRCSEMVSCEEAMHYLKTCGPEYLDGDRDGIPCEKLCQPELLNQKKEQP